MICYQSAFKTTDQFNQEILIQTFLDWLETTKNKMNNLTFNQIPFEYQIDHKHLIMKKFKNNIFGIYFSTYDNYKNFKFIVEIFYNETKQEIQLQFSKESREDSGYISRVSIPKVFRTLIQSIYLKENKHLNPIIQINPTYLNQKELEFELIGIASIEINNNLKNNIHILYPNHTEEMINFPSKIGKYEKYNFYNKIRQYHIKNSTTYSFKDLSLKELKEEYQNIQEDSLNLQQSFNKEINQEKEEIKELKLIYEIYQEELKQLKQEKETLTQRIGYTNDTPLLVIDANSDLTSYQELIYNILKRKENDLSSTNTIYRRLDIIQSILEKGKKL